MNAHRVSPTIEEFRQRCTRGNVVPVWREMLADMETPVSVFRKLEGESPFAFLLESVEQGERLGRFSFIGAEPFLIFKCKGSEQEVVAGGEEQDFRTKDTPLATLRHLMDRYRPVPDPALPPFFGGAVGYLSYDAVRFFEELPDKNADDSGVPDCLFMFTDWVVAFDHVKHRLLLIVNARTGEEGNVDRAYHRATALLDRLRERVKSAPPSPPPRRPTAPPREPVPSVTKTEFADAVKAAKEYIAAGDIFQVVLSQRFELPVAGDGFDVYRALRALNPSPYLFYLKCGHLRIAGSSPEVLSRCSAGKVVVRPIAGTRPRGATPEEDRRLEAELLADAKERAEHLMLVDLGRNDVGRVAKFGTVAVDEFMTVERYSHVMHLVSNVVGDLAPGKDAFDVLEATFPAGTLTGAPKIRAMEIIDSLEPLRRGPYGGAVVYFGFNGAMDSCILIRSAVIRDHTATVQAGAGIVADSIPEAEYDETVNKAKALLHAIEVAEAGLD